MIYGLGMLDSGMTWDYAQAVMQNEMVRMIVAAIRGIPLTDENLSLDVIAAVGPGGEFITHEHTFKNMKQQSQVDLFDRNTREVWEAGGKKDMVELSYEKALHILDTHKPKPLSEKAQIQLNEIFDEAVKKAGSPI